MAFDRLCVVNMAPRPFLLQLEGLLRKHPEGLSEHELIRALRGQGCEWLPELARRDLFGLFRTHFRLFHALYRLRDQLRERREGDLVPDPLRLRIAAWRPGTAAMDRADPVAEWYRDEGRLEATGPREVARMLADMARLRQPAERRQEALAKLGLEEPASDSTIRRRYRELAMRHHPDRGGDARAFVAIQAAVRDLL